MSTNKSIPNCKNFLGIKRFRKVISKTQIACRLHLIIRVVDPPPPPPLLKKCAKFFFVILSILTTFSNINYFFIVFHAAGTVKYKTITQKTL